MVKKIPLTQGKFALVDDEDFEWLNQFKWHVQYQPTIDGFYARRNQYIGYFNGKQKQKMIFMHRLIMERVIGHELQRSEFTDHINHDPVDNRRENLRIVSNRQNQQNQKNKKSSKYPGVYWYKQDKKWRAKIKLNGKSKHLGSFIDERDAAMAYERACRGIVGEELVCKATGLEKQAHSYVREAIGDNTYWED